MLTKTFNWEEELKRHRAWMKKYEYQRKVKEFRNFVARKQGMKKSEHF